MWTDHREWLCLHCQRTGTIAAPARKVRLSASQHSQQKRSRGLSGNETKPRASALMLDGSTEEVVDLGCSKAATSNPSVQWHEAIVDLGCSKTMSSLNWVETYTSRMAAEQGRRSISSPSRQQYKVANGKTIQCQERRTVPVCLAGMFGTIDVE